MRGLSFGFKGQMAYKNNLVQTLLYNLFIGLLVGLQVFSGVKLLKGIENSQARLMRLSLLTVGFCSILDFSSAMRFMQMILTISVS
jgi:hypothetical protein